MVTVLHHTRPDAMASLVTRFPDVAFVPIPMTGVIAPDVRGDIILTTAIGAETLVDALSRGVRWVHTIGTGVDRFPVDAVQESQVLTCSRGASAIPIAEWTLAMMLAFEKRLPDSWITAPPVAPGRWHQADNGGLFGATVAILGLGSIGVEVAGRALAFGMHVRGVRRTGGAPSPLAGIELVTTAADAVAGAQHVVIATPLTPKTHHLVDASLFAQFAPGAHLVNIARGAIIDQDALRVALDDGTLACASLDTVDPEPLPDDHWLYTHARVRLSPHISWCMPSAMPLLYQMFGENLGRYLAGTPLAGIVDRGERY